MYDDIGRLQKHQVVKRSISECLKFVERMARLRRMDIRMQRHAQGMLDECVFKLVKTKGCPIQRPSAVAEIQVINELGSFFLEKETMEQRQRLCLFRIIFLGREDEAEVHECRLDFLARFVNVSIFLQWIPILTDTALWLQEELLIKGQIGPIHAFCGKIAAGLFVGDLDNHSYDHPLLSLGDLCPSLAIILLLFLIDERDHFVMPRIALLQSVAEWLTEQPKALFILLRDAGSSKSAFAVTVFDLVSQCMDKLACLCVTYAIKAEGDVSDSVALTMSKIRLALLKILQTMPKVSSSELKSCSLSGRYAGEMLLQVADYKRRRESFDAKLNGALDAFGQIMVTALIGNAFAGSKHDFNMSVCYQLTYGHPLLNYFFSVLS
ncbi:hypothetical protein M514_02670 [Trichuris suis]|uniref:Uncharacterized protein n=1 Tax=Trichuris suis TaxID=68888 RepID=A0A085NNP6_9BILA|nr:hypothetical protein M513_02670 [Trichuris suis]KFD71092.1 hypothetical protein M514_02670 [Trichuris suis]KHJ48658.1 hypothetical protein D918_00960 [Trichuris suis]